MALEVTDSQIKNALGDLIKTSVMSLYSAGGANIIPRVHRRWVLSHNIGESSALLKAIEGDYKGKVHCWMIGTEGYKRIRPSRGVDTLGLAVNGTLKQRQPDVRYVIKQYKVWVYLQLDTGNDDTNSENRLLSEIEYVSNELSKYPKLNLTSDQVQGHGELNFASIDTYKFGELQVNVAKGTLDLYLFEQF